jgi:hypothetical protein
MNSCDDHVFCFFNSPALFISLVLSAQDQCLPQARKYDPREALRTISFPSQQVSNLEA